MCVSLDITNSACPALQWTLRAFWQQVSATHFQELFVRSESDTPSILM